MEDVGDGVQAAESGTQESVPTIEVVNFGDDARGNGPLLSSANTHDGCTGALFKSKKHNGYIVEAPWLKVAK